ncbi:MAG TPA: hypothetical protein DEF51_02875, partial [Myxococcales bacterium]|nr:hypothetical protein [Myxococcales bacterium]
EAVRPRIYLTPETVDILRAADRIRGQTVPNQPRIDARHLAAAFLLEPVAWQGFSDLTRRDQNAPAWEFFASAIESQIIDSLWEGEDEDAWRQIFQTVAGNGSPLIVTPQGAPVPRYSRDKPWVGDKGELQSDPLGVVADARAMADLILLKEPGPPLAIGLFGDWGSGKSTFMDILRR